MELPLISVITPVYRVEKFLDCCVSSILDQSYGNLELILVDDGSPDNSGRLCDAWEAKDARVRVIHQENRGGGAARNAALDAARGELIAFVDSDDYIAPEMFETLYGLIASGADVAECGYQEVTEDGASFPAGQGQIATYTVQEAMGLHITDTAFRQLIWNKLYKRELVEGVRFPVGTKIDDEFFTYRVLGSAKVLKRTDKVCYAYRQQSGSVMHEKFSLRRAEGLNAKVERLDYLKEKFPDLADQAREDLILSCVFVMQGSLKGLRGQELAQAKALVKSCLEAAKPCRGGDGKLRRVLLILAQKDVVLTARLLNFLIDIHVLT